MISIMYEKVSNRDFKRILNFKDLKKMIEYMKGEYHEWIIDFQDKGEGFEFTITEYDDYIE